MRSLACGSAATVAAVLRPRMASAEEGSLVPVVRVVGAECAARERVARALATALNAEAQGGAAGAGAARVSWRARLRTRYYEAEVELVALAEPADAPGAMRRAQAVIAVAGAAEEVAGLLAALGPALDVDAIESRAVVVADRLLAEDGAHGEDADGPLLEHGFESVYDIARLKELLEVTMWRGMKLLSGTGAVAGIAGAVPPGLSPVGSPHSLAATSSTRHNAQFAPAAAATADAAVEDADDDDDDDVSATFGDWSSWKSGKDSLRGGADADGFGALIDQVRAMRSMPEAVRKEQAAEMALRLAAMLGVDGDDESDDDDDDDDDDDRLEQAVGFGFVAAAGAAAGGAAPQGASASLTRNE